MRYLVVKDSLCVLMVDDVLRHRDGRDECLGLKERGVEAEDVDVVVTRCKSTAQGCLREEEA